MIKYSLAFLAGNVLLHQFSQLDTQQFWFLLSVALLVLTILFILGYFCKSYHYKNFLYTLSGLSFFFFSSFFSSYYSANQALLNLLPEQLQAREIVIQGYIDSIPVETQRSYKFNFRLFNVISPAHNYANSQNSQRIRLSWYKNSSPELLKNSTTKLIVGDYWQFKVKLKRPSGLLNPGTMDYEKWLFAHQIRAVGYIRKGEENKQLLTQTDSIKQLSKKQSLIYALDRLRQELSKKLQKVLANNEFKGIYLALILGIKDQITDKQWSVFLDSGTNHLIAISGLHIGLFAAIGFFIGSRLWSFSAYMLNFSPAQQAGALTALVFAIVYAALAGFSIPTQRALIMVSLVLSAIFFRIRLPSSLVLSYALILVLLIDPMASLSIGFWLSFSAVAIILYSISKKTESDRQTDKPELNIPEHKSDLVLRSVQFIGKLSRMQVIIFLGLLPFSLLFFSRLLLLSPIANLIAVPWMSLMITPMVLFSAVLAVFSTSDFFLQLSAFLFVFISYLMQPMWLFLKIISETENNLIYPDINNIFVIVPVLLGLLLFFILRQTNKRWFALLFLIPLLLPVELPKKLLININNRFFPQIAQGEFKVSVLDVGQGLSVVVQTQNHVMVYDTGNAFNSRFDMANQVVIPFLRQRSIYQIDKLVLSHADHDHVGSAPSLLAQYQVDETITGEPERLFNKLEVVAGQCLSGQKWSWDQVEFQVIYPQSNDLNKNLKSNNLSCVIVVKSASDQRLILTGDIEKKIEKQLARSIQIKNTDILIAPHHGSKSSSNQKFIDWLNPKIVVFTNAYLNRYHFPSKLVVKRYRQQGSLLYSTQNGLIEMLSGNPDLAIKVTEYRKDKRHYWNRDYKALQ
ncbi:MAG: DNA internalization-related competence protein ComEC/Rec2 [Pseudomonadota bacterium]